MDKSTNIVVLLGQVLIVVLSFTLLINIFYITE